MDVVRGSRRVWLLAAAILGSAALFYLYEGLRRARAKDFPFQWGPLYLHALLLVAIGLLMTIFIWAGLGGSKPSIWSGVVLVVPSLLLAAAPYVKGVLEWAWYPDRFVGEGFHQLGAVGVGAGIAMILLAALAHKSSDEPVSERT